MVVFENLVKDLEAKKWRQETGLDGQNRFDKRSTEGVESQEFSTTNLVNRGREWGGGKKPKQGRGVGPFVSGGRSFLCLHFNGGNDTLSKKILKCLAFS